MITLTSRINYFLNREKKLQKNLETLTDGDSAESKITPYPYYVLSLSTLVGVVSTIAGLILKQYSACYFGVVLAVTNALGAYAVRLLHLTQSPEKTRNLITLTDENLKLTVNELIHLNAELNRNSGKIDKEITQYKQLIKEQTSYNEELIKKIQSLSDQLEKTEGKLESTASIYHSLSETVSRFIDVHPEVLSEEKLQEESLKKIMTTVKQASSAKLLMTYNENELKNIAGSIKKISERVTLLPPLIKNQIHETQKNFNESREIHQALINELNELDQQENDFPKQLKNLADEKLRYETQINKMINLIPEKSMADQIIKLQKENQELRKTTKTRVK